MLSTKGKLLTLSTLLPSEHLTVAVADYDVYCDSFTDNRWQRCDCFIAFHLYATFSFIITQMHLSFVKKDCLLVFFYPI